jgi:hypothetical protein
MGGALPDLQRRTYLSYIYLGYVICLSVIVVSLLRNTVLSLGFNNQTDQGEETASLEWEGTI